MNVSQQTGTSYRKLSLLEFAMQAKARGEAQVMELVRERAKALGEHLRAKSVASPKPVGQQQPATKQNAIENKSQDSSTEDKGKGKDTPSTVGAGDEVKQVKQGEEICGSPRSATTHVIQKPLNAHKPEGNEASSTGSFNDGKPQSESEATCKPGDTNTDAAPAYCSPPPTLAMDQQNEKQKAVENDSPNKDAAKAKQKSKGKLSAMHKTSGEVKEVKKDEEACETVTSTSCSSTTAHDNQTSSQVPKSEDDATSSTATLNNKQPQLPAEKAPCKSQSPKSASPPQSSPPLSQPSTWDLFVSRRSQLLQEAIQDSVRTGTFHNVEIYTYRKRGKKSRCAHVPAVIYGRASLLEAASPVLKDLLSSGKTQLNNILSANYDFEYLDDSDFEDEEPEIPESLLTDNSKPSDEISDIASNASTFDLLDSPQFSLCIVAIDERGEEPSKPPVVESNASTVTKVEPPEPLSREVVYTPFGATRTWQALMAYLYDGTISFCSLRSSSAQPKMKDGVSCSPKSMYSLAKKLELTDLAKDCENAIVEDLGPSNVVKELFSDFTWRYPEILNREVTVFTKHSQDDRVRSNLKQAFHDMASGKLPRRGIVLSSLFDDILPPVLVVSH